MNITIKTKDWFFDRQKVVDALKKAKRKSLREAGGFVRTTARRSMKRVSPAKRAKLAERGQRTQSPAGSPPNCHVQGPSLKTILFAFEPSTESVIVGPVQFNTQNSTIAKVQSTTPGLHERGESATIREFRVIPAGENPSSIAWQPVRKKGAFVAKFGARIEQRRRRVKYPKRAFMNPALEKASPKFPELFKNSIVSSR